MGTIYILADSVDIIGARNLTLIMVVYIDISYTGLFDSGLRGTASAAGVADKQSNATKIRDLSILS